jgi:hypothetical protein
MKKHKICYFVSFGTLILTAFFIISEIVFEDDTISVYTYFAWDYMCIMFFPLALYWTYSYSETNKILAFTLALLNDYICFFSRTIIYHYTTNFQYLDDAETQGVFGIMVIAKIITTIIALIIYGIVLVYLPWRRNRLEKK